MLGATEDVSYDGGMEVTESSVQIQVSVVIPAFNSEKFLVLTVNQLLDTMNSQQQSFEVVIVDDGSGDKTWEVIEQLATANDQIVGIRLLKNYGQHSALLCGLRHTKGNFVVTMDDDLQNPPNEIPRMIAFIKDNNHDLVIGRFVEPQKARIRIVGTGLVDRIVNKVFNKDPELSLSTFRVVRRDVVERVCRSNNPTPYITGELLYAAGSIANFDVRHDKRIQGKSTYNPLKILELVRRITFSYSIELLRASSRVGVVVSLISFLLSTALTIRGVLTNGVVPGWTSMVTATSFFAAIIILLLSMIGEYLAIVLLQTSGTPAYREAGIVKNGFSTGVETKNHPWEQLGN
jgi:glycosyltransferase involved in cell wall biosynthesis